MKRMRVTGDNSTQVVQLFGDPARQQEPKEFRIEFPGGYVYVARVQREDGGFDFWAHTGVFHADHPDKHRIGNMDDHGDPKATGKIVDARIDRWDKGAAETIELAGALEPNVDHVAVRVRPKPPGDS